MNQDDLEGSKRRARLVDLEQVYDLCPDFIAKRKPQAITSTLIEEFIENTSHLDTEIAYRLIPFAVHVKRDFGFEGLSQVFKYLIETEKEDLHAGTYASWIGIGLVEMKDSEANALAERSKIAASLRTILEQAGGSEDSINGESNYVSLWAEYYYNHPERRSNSKHLLHATKYYQLSVDQKLEDDEIDAYSLCQLANCYFDLAQYNKAELLYKKINLSDLDATGRISQEAVIAGLATCKIKLDKV